MKILTLDKLPLNITAKIYSLNCDDILRRRLLDLGLIDGTKITPIFNSPFGDPIAYKIRSSTIALRKDDVKNITCIITL
ncbi:MAG: ferrous iron transport protein A [Clostridiales bacterium]|nr:ferrous iron transport protein A [Clostridiales bacterium]